MPAQKFFLRAALAAALALSAASAFAQTFNWTNTATSGLWTTPANWSNSTVPTNGPGDAVNLNANFTSLTLITLDTSAIVGTMIYGDSSGTAALYFTNTVGSTLTFNNNGSASTLSFQGGQANVYAPILLANDLNIASAVNTYVYSDISASSSGLKTITMSNAVTYTGNISDGAGAGPVALVAPSGGLTLSTSNSFSGGVTVGRGNLFLGNNNSLGTGTLLITNGGSAVIINATNITVANSVRMVGNSMTGNGTLTIGGPVTVVSNSTINRGGTTDITGDVYLSETDTVGRTLTLGANGGTSSGSISGVIANFNGVGGTGGSLTKLGTGTWTLSGSNTFTGSTSIGQGNQADGGTLKVTGAGKIGSNQLNVISGILDISGATNTQTVAGISMGGAAAGNSATILIGSGTLSLINNVSFSTNNHNNGAIISGDGGGVLSLNANRSFTVGDSTNAAVDLTVSAIVANGDATAPTVTKAGSGVMVFSGANTYSGATTVSAGVLNIQNATALGTTAAGTTVASGAALQLQGGISVGAETLALSGTGVSSDGALRNISGNNTYGGTITNTAAARINSDAGTLTLSGNINATNQAITFGGAGNIVANGAITNSTAGLTKDGAGTLTLAVANTYSGATTVSGGTLAVNGSINSAATVQSGATLAGTGSVKSATIASGGTISPGNSPGTLTLTNGMTWDGGGNYNWQIFDVADPSKRDLIDVTGGTFTLNGLSDVNQFNINLWSLSGLGPDTNGAVYNFNNTQSYSWRIVSSANPISGTFSNSCFNINTGATNGTGGFANDLGGGLFSVAMDGNNLNLVFTPGSSPIPEPGTWATAALLAGAAALIRRRRQKSA